MMRKKLVRIDKGVQSYYAVFDIFQDGKHIQQIVVEYPFSGGFTEESIREI